MTTIKERRKKLGEQLLCFECLGITCSYMVHDSVWNKALPNYLEWKRQNKREHIVLCFPCLEGLLGRKLTIDDFDERLPINQGVLIGYQIGFAARSALGEDA